MTFNEKIHHINIRPPWSRRNYNVYFIEDERPCLIDAGPGDWTSIRAIRDALERLGHNISNLSIIVNTHAHPDHTGGDTEIQGASMAEVAAHPLEAPSIKDPEEVWRTESEKLRERLKTSGTPAAIAQKILLSRRVIGLAPKRAVTVNRLLKEGDMLDIGSTKLRVVHTPGHTQGHICLYDEGRRILFSGDHVLKVTTPNVGRLRDYLNSLRRLLDLDIGIILPGHEGIITNPQDRIKEIIDHHSEREEAFLDLISNGNGKTLYELVVDYWGRLPGHHLVLALREGYAHVEKLVEDNRAAVEKRGTVSYYTALRV